MAKTKKSKKNPPQKPPENQNPLTDPLPAAPPGFDPFEAAQEVLDRLGTAVPSVKSDGEVVRWLSEADFQAIEYRLSRIIDGG